MNNHVVSTGKPPHSMETKASYTLLGILLSSGKLRINTPAIGMSGIAYRG